MHASTQPPTFSGEEEYYVLIVGLNFEGDEVPHSPTHPFCLDPKCPCKEDRNAVQTVGAWVNEGLVTTREADLFYQGKTF